MSEAEPEEVFKLDDNRELRIYQDTSPQNPRIEFDNIGTMVCVHNNYDLGDEVDFDKNEIESMTSLREYLETVQGALVTLPIYMQDHSGITLRTTSFNDPWDSRKIGFIYATSKSIKELGEDWKTAAKVVEVLRGEVETYNQYLQGDIYGFQIIKLTKCKCCDHVSEEEEEAVWGYYGTDWEKNGLFEAAGYKPEKKEE